MRKLVQKEMLRPDSALHYVSEMEDVINDLVNRIEKDKNEEGKMDIQSLMKDFATDAITVPFLGAKIGALQGSEEGKEMAYGATRILELWSQMMFYPPWLYKIHPKTTELSMILKY